MPLWLDCAERHPFGTDICFCYRKKKNELNYASSGKVGFLKLVELGACVFGIMISEDRALGFDTGLLPLPKGTRTSKKETLWLRSLP
jgi:hypothetical protein